VGTPPHAKATQATCGSCMSVCQKHISKLFAEKHAAGQWTRFAVDGAAQQDACGCLFCPEQCEIDPDSDSRKVW